ncbi:MAG: metallophosphoesterase [Bacteroidales bacterium]|nr:metallophosphoesterase [Bacteroidales bacterium]
MSEEQAEVRILATADIHFGGPMCGRKAERLLRSLTDAWCLTVRACIDLKADVVLIAGDLIDLDTDFEKVNEKLGSSFETLCKKGVNIVLNSGNHDYYLLPFFLGTQSFNHVTLLGADGNWDAIIMEKHDTRFGIAGRSFPKINQQSDPLYGVEEMLEGSLFPLTAKMHYDTKKSDILFESVEIERLFELPAEAWMLMHLHKDEVLIESPLVTYPGKLRKHSKIL